MSVEGPSGLWLVGLFVLCACGDARPDARAADEAVVGSTATAEPTETGESNLPPSSSAAAASATVRGSGTAVAGASGTATATASANAAPAGKPVTVTVGEPKFTSGDIPKAQGSLEKLAKKVKACVDDNGGLLQTKGQIELQFLVRAGGVAEGVDILEAKGVTAEASRCVRDLVKKKSIGTPSEDPIGVTVVLELSPTS